MGQNYHRMEDQKPWPNWALEQNFAEGKKLERKPKKLKMSNLRDVLSKVIQLKQITDGGLGAEPPAAERFFVIFWKKSYFNAIESHFPRVQSHLKVLDF